MYEEAMATLINAYSSVLDIPKEQIVSFIEENNITVNDLTDPAFVQSFVMDLEGRAVPQTAVYALSALCFALWRRA